MQPDARPPRTLAPGQQPLRSIKDLPGPRAWPLVGNALHITPSRIHQDVERWSRQYGAFFQMRFGPLRWLVVADHAAISAILRDRPDGFRRPGFTTDIAVEMQVIPGLFLAEGIDWKNQRRMVMSAFAPAAIKAYFPTLVKVALRLQKRWDHAARQRLLIDLAADLKRYTVDIIAGLAFGTDVNTLESGADVIQRQMDDILPAIARRSLSLLPYWRYFKLPADRRLERSMAAVTRTVNDFIAQARMRMQAEPARHDHPRNLLEALIAAADTNNSGIDDRSIAGNVLTMLLAGEDTTANTLAWMIYLLQRHPQALQRAQEEVRQVAPDPAAFSIETMDALDYLDACASEAMRLKPVGAYLPLEALRETVIAGIHVPAGTHIWCVMRHDSVDERFFPNASTFDPQRWLQGADKHVSLPFGAGARTCPGRYLALLEIKIAMAMLLGSFDIDCVNTPDGKEAQELMGFVMSPVGLWMRLQPRRSISAP